MYFHGASTRNKADAARRMPTQANPVRPASVAACAPGKSRIMNEVRAKPSLSFRAVTTTAVAILAFCVRILNWPQVFTPAGVHFVEGDCFYHMRRTFLALQRGLSVPSYDPYMNFPDGFHCNWPPLFDQFLAALSWAFGGGHASTQTVETVCALIPPALGATTCVVLFFIAEFYLTQTGAAAAAVLLAILPFHVQVSVLGRPDHHVAVALAASTLWLLSLKMSSSSDMRVRLTTGCLAGVVLSLSLRMWPGSILMAVVLVLWWLASAIRASIRLRHDPETWNAPVILAAAALATLPWAYRPARGIDGMLRWDELNALHVIALASAAAACAGLTLLARPFEQRSMLPRRVTGACLLAASCIGAAVCAGPILSGSRWTFVNESLLKFAEESMPVTWHTFFQNFTGLALFLPIVAFFALSREWPREGWSRSSFLAAWTCATWLPAAFKERFSDLASFAAAILAVRLIESIAGALHHPSFSRRSPLFARIAPFLSTAVLLCVMMAPPLSWLRMYAASAPVLSFGYVYEVCGWLRENTPPTAGYDGLDRHPEYSVLAPWNWGNAIVFIGHRPNVANNFIGWPENQNANIAPYRFYLAMDTNEAERILRLYGVRYLIIQESVASGELASMLDVLGVPLSEFFEPDSKAGRGAMRLKPNAFECMGLRLFLSNTNGLHPFIPVYESKESINAAGCLVPRLRIFEYAGYRPPALRR